MRSNTKWDRRDRKRNKRRHGMKIDGKSVFIIQETIIKRGGKK